MNIPSVLRIEEHKALSNITLIGTVLDLGGVPGGEYQRVIKGEHTFTSLNLSPETKPDILHDLEKPLPLADASYDNVLLINVLEHIYEYRKLIDEAVRVLKSGGTLVVIVPFLFPIHPSPEDYHRYTASTLQKEFESRNMKSISIKPLGKGVFTAGHLLIDRLMPGPVRFVSLHTLRYLAYALDALFSGLSRLAGKSYHKDLYPLGYCAIAVK